MAFPQFDVGRLTEAARSNDRTHTPILHREDGGHTRVTSECQGILAELVVDLFRHVFVERGLEPLAFTQAVHHVVERVCEEEIRKLLK